PLLAQIEDPIELKVILRVVWHLGQKRRAPRAVTLSELKTDVVLLEILTGKPDFEVALQGVLGAAVRHKVLAQGASGSNEPVYALNTETGRQTVGRISDVRANPDMDTEPVKPAPRSNIFTLYEDNIGTLSPLIVEELQEAEKTYPKQWVTDAFKEAVANNKRSWRYIARILERWEREGRGGDSTFGKPGDNVSQTREFRY
ncbi:MAG: DnaD domain protein, partial [Chloroflexi bacterium]|nr:DnaD domain protein [Chloroflexota bacterium]